LQRDLADPERARRGHGRERRDLPELALERRRHQRRDGVGISARKLRRDLDGREIDLRQRRDRQPPIAQQSSEHHRDAEQGGRDPPGEWGRGNAHCWGFGLPRWRRWWGCAGGGAAAGSLLPIPTSLPSLSRAKPVVTTRSGGSTPLLITACVSFWRSTTTGR